MRSYSRWAKLHPRYIVIPATVVEIRKELCRECVGKAHDPCAVCDHGRWGKYEIIGCDDPDRQIPTVSNYPVPPQPSILEKMAPSIRQPGDVFSYVIFKVTGQRAGSCGRCQSRIKEMNNSGWLWCWRNRRQIVGWLTMEAKLRGYHVENMYDLFKAALREARDKRGKIK